MLNRCVVALLCSISARALPCALADSGSLQTHVLGEEAIIVFDEKAGLQHFIRSAEFYPGGKSFGFIVPTPTEPTFAEIDQTVFAQLASAYEAARPEETKLELGSLLGLTLKAGERDGLVEVLRSERVAGLDVAVLKASDSAALASWLEKHGFTMRPALAAWLEGYVQQGFVFSAFKYEGEARRPMGSSAVRITFSTATPFYPYREPGDSVRSQGLRLWMIAPQGRDWVEPAGADGPLVLARSSAIKLPGALEALLAGPRVVTLFDDERARRPAHDVRFEPSTTAEFLLPHLQRIPVPLEGLCCPLVIGAIAVLGVRWKKRSRRTLG